jgi:hypothetical protein
MMDPVVMPPVMVMPMVVMPVVMAPVMPMTPVMMKRGFRRIGCGDRDARKDGDEAEERGCGAQGFDHDEISPFLPLIQAWLLVLIFDVNVK